MASSTAPLSRSTTAILEFQKWGLPLESLKERSRSGIRESPGSEQPRALKRNIAVAGSVEMLWVPNRNCGDPTTGGAARNGT